MDSTFGHHNGTKNHKNGREEEHYSRPPTDYYDQSSSPPKNHAARGHGYSSAYSDPTQGYHTASGGYSSGYSDATQGHAASGGHGYSSGYSDPTQGHAASGGHGYSSGYSDQPLGHAASGGHGYSSAYSDQPPQSHGGGGDYGYSSQGHAASGGHGYSSAYSDPPQDYDASGGHGGYSSAYSSQPPDYAGTGDYGYSSVPTAQPHHHHNSSKPSSHHNDTHSKGSKSTVKIFCKANPGYSISIRDDEVILAPSNPSDECQHWIKDNKYSAEVKDEEGFSSFVLVNNATGEAMKHSSGSEKPVQLIPYDPDVYDESIVWSQSKDFGDGFKTIRMAKNIRLNLDAFHGEKGDIRDGTAVVLWEWKHGDNQLWKITPYGH